MTGVLDPNGTWFWLLYLLAGIGWVVATQTYIINAQEDDWVRAVLASSPPLRAALAIIMWATWPLAVAAVVATCVAWLAMQAWSWVEYAGRWTLWRLRRRPQ